MVTLKDILEAEPHQAVLLRTQWKEVRGLLPTTGVPNDVMRYIEELEAKLSIAVIALQSNAVPAIGGKAQQYTAQHALKEIEAYGRKEPT